MKDENILIVEYKEDFAQNLNSIAYAKILENKFQKRTYFKNITSQRNFFEDYTSNINYKSEYISINRANEIAKKAYYLSNLPNRFSELFSKNKHNILNSSEFKIDDIRFLNDDIKESLKFNSYDFIRNHDILEKIQNTNSVGIFIDSQENKTDEIQKFLFRATKRLNKYII